MFEADKQPSSRVPVTRRANHTCAPDRRGAWNGLGWFCVAPLFYGAASVEAGAQVPLVPFDQSQPPLLERYYL